MKSMIFAFAVVVSASALAQQDLTNCEISANKKYATCLVEDGGESGMEKRYVTFKIRKGSSATPNLGCSVGEAHYEPCAEGNVPKWLRDLNKAFEDAGFSAPDTSAQDELSPGGN